MELDLGNSDSGKAVDFYVILEDFITPYRTVQSSSFELPVNCNMIRPVPPNVKLTYVSELVSFFKTIKM
jgi:hypothetical protein